MPRKYMILKQFLADMDRLLGDAERAFDSLRSDPSHGHSKVLALFHPIHSLKGICGMVEETKPLVQVFHRFEDALPPLLPVRLPAGSVRKDWVAAGAKALAMARQVQSLLRSKVELWERLGVEENASKGLVVKFFDAGRQVKVWVPITSLVGLVDDAGSPEGNEVFRVGDASNPTSGVASDSGERLLIEADGALFALLFDDLGTSCTRLDAIQDGVPDSFKEWWAKRASGSASSAA